MFFQLNTLEFYGMHGVFQLQLSINIFELIQRSYSQTRQLNVKALKVCSVQQTDFHIRNESLHDYFICNEMLKENQLLLLCGVGVGRTSGTEAGFKHCLSVQRELCVLQTQKAPHLQRCTCSGVMQGFLRENAVVHCQRILGSEVNDTGRYAYSSVSFSRHPVNKTQPGFSTFVLVCLLCRVGLFTLTLHFMSEQRARIILCL